MRSNRFGLARLLARTSKSTVANAMTPLQVYLTLRDVLKETGIAEPDYIEIEADYFFVDEDGSVFVVQEAGWIYSAKKIFVAGPRVGEEETISTAKQTEYKKEAERVWGRYIPGGLFWQPRFIPGTERQSLPLYDENYFRIGDVDEDGVHRYNDRIRRSYEVI